jgi:hypothetical protein
MVRLREGGEVDMYGDNEAVALMDEAVVRNYFDRVAGACRGLTSSPTTPEEIASCQESISAMYEFLATVESLYESARLSEDQETVQVRVEGSTSFNGVSMLGAMNLADLESSLGYTRTRFRLSQELAGHPEWWSGDTRGQGSPTATTVPTDWGNYRITDPILVSEIRRVYNENGEAQAEDRAKAYITPSDPDASILWIQIVEMCENCVEVMVVVHLPTGTGLTNATLGYCRDVCE